MGEQVNRRAFLSGLAGAGGFAIVQQAGLGTAESHCTPGHNDGDSACRQIYDDRKVLTPFQPEDNRLPVDISHPCGWTTVVNVYDDRVQLNASRSQIGEDNAYVDIQVRGHYEPVEETLIQDIKSEGDYVEVDYEFAGQTLTGLVSSRDTAQYGTVGHAAIPMGESYVHIELISTMKGTECTLDPRPDWWAVRDMLGTLAPNRESTFIEDSGYLPDYATARIDRDRITYDEANDRVELPAKSNARIPGITNLSTESTLTVQVNSKAGQGEGAAFFDLQEGIQVQRAPDRDWQLWKVINEADFVDQEGSEVEIKIIAPGYEGTLQPGDAIDGIVVDWVELLAFEFTDKTSGGGAIIVDRLETSDGGSIVLEDDADTTLGSTDQLEGGSYEELPVSLDEPLPEGTHDVTATAYQPSGEPYPGDSTRSATITVEKSDVPAVFELSNLDPTTIQVDAPGETATVTVTVENVGSQTATQDVTIQIEGSIAETKTVTLEGGESTTLRFDLDTSQLNGGTRAAFQVATQDDSVAGVVDVAESTTAATADHTDSTTGDTGGATSSGAEGPGFEVGGTIVAVLAAMGLARRYTDSE
jgi:PGF-CTERM protein